MIEFPGALNPARPDVTETSSGRGYFVQPAAGGGPGVLLLHAWWGLNETIKQMAGRLADEGFTVLAPDMFDGKVATNIEQAEAQSGARESSEEGQIALEQIVLGAADELARRATDKMAPVGFSFGAAYALWLAVKRPAQIPAVVLFYGTYEGVGGQAPVLGHFAIDDQWAYDKPEDLDAFEKHLRDSGRQTELHRYPNTKHWFAEPDRPEYDAAAADLAWQRTFDFLRLRLGQ